MNYFGGNSGFYYNCIQDAYRALKPYLKSGLRMVIQTGSGFDFLSGISLAHRHSIPYAHIPHFPPTSVKGHSGKLHVFGKEDKTIVVLEGRSHGYEGRDAWELAFPIRVLALAKPDWVLLTNAVGGINPKLKTGDLVMITHHINQLGMNPMQGLDEQIFGSRFVPMDHVYDKKVYELCEQAVKKEKLKINLHRGTYFANPGPTFETEKEIDMEETMHADVVGMSTVVEAISARACGLRVAALSLVTNMACGRGHSDFTHEEVLQVAQRSKQDILKLISYVIKHAI